MSDPVSDPLLSRISVVVPVLNSLELVREGMEHMRAWAPFVREVIVVDSQSTDGTLESLREQLPFAHVSFHQRPRGLYAAWNYGISQCGGEWVHISTAGDTISPADLRYLAEVAESSQVDVVTAPPRFIHKGGGAGHYPVWPIHHLLERHAGEERIVLEGPSLLSFTLEFCRLSQVIQCWLGSSASNLYRRRIFESGAFPTDSGHSGDVMFSLRHAHRLRAAFVRRECGQFVMHPPAAPHPEMLEVYGELYAAEYSAQLRRLQDFVLRSLRGGTPDLWSGHVFHPAEEASLLAALAHSPEKALKAWKLEDHLMRELNKKMAQCDELNAKKTTLRAERDTWKGRAREAEAALKHCRGRIPSVLRPLLGLNAPPAGPRKMPSSPESPGTNLEPATPAEAKAAILALEKELSRKRQSPWWILQPAVWKMRQEKKVLRNTKKRLEAERDARKKARAEAPPKVKKELQPASEGEILREADALITPAEINNGHGTGVLLERLFRTAPDYLHIRSLNLYGGVTGGTQRFLIPQGQAAKLEEMLGGTTVRRILCVPYCVADIENTLELQRLTGAPLCVWLMDHNLGDGHGQIPAPLMRRLLDAARLLLAISPEFCDLYQKEFGREVHFVPPVVEAALGQLSPLRIPAETLARPAGVLLGNIWSQRWLEKLVRTVDEAALPLTAYGHTSPAWVQHQALKDLVALRGFLPEEELVPALRAMPFAVVPTGTLDADDDRPEIARYSLPSRTIYLCAVGNLPIIVTGHADSGVARFVLRHGLGIVVPYEGARLREAADWICDPTRQQAFRENAAALARAFACDGAADWIWRSLDAGAPADSRWELSPAAGTPGFHPPAASPEKQDGKSFPDPDASSAQIPASRQPSPEHEA